MNSAMVKAMLRELREIKRQAVRYRQGVVTDTSPLSVALGGSDEFYVGVQSVADYTPRVGDIVSVLMFGNDLLVVGLVKANATGLFSAYRSGSSQVAATGTYTAIVFGTEEFDVSGWYDPTTGRYTPQVPGYYRLNAGIGTTTTVGSGTRLIASIAKNGSDHKRLQTIYVAGGDDNVLTGTCIVEANGSTDYFAAQFHQNTGGNVNVIADAHVTYFQGQRIA